jgi:hypothetical protein
LAGPGASGILGASPPIAPGLSGPDYNKLPPKLLLSAPKMAFCYPTVGQGRQGVPNRSCEDVLTWPREEPICWGISQGPLRPVDFLLPQDGQQVAASQELS